MFSIIIPVYNEVSTINEIINKIHLLKIDKEVIIIDDFSSDGTKNLLEKIKSDTLKILYNDKNYGKGYCIRRGIQVANGNYVIIQDADLEYNPNEIYEFLEIFKKYDADVIYGSRFRGGKVTKVLFFWHTLGNKFLTFLSNCFTNFNLTDMEVCYKAFKSNIIKSIELKENRFGFEPEVTAKISKLNGISIYEIGISYDGRSYKAGKKIGWKDGFSAIRCILKYNLFKN
jgi:glycosyltransferase involved in cell wall biosynthesis